MCGRTRHEPMSTTTNKLNGFPPAPADFSHVEIPKSSLGVLVLVPCLASICLIRICLISPVGFKGNRFHWQDVYIFASGRICKWKLVVRLGPLRTPRNLDEWVLSLTSDRALRVDAKISPGVVPRSPSEEVPSDGTDLAIKFRKSDESKSDQSHVVPLKGDTPYESTGV